MGTGLRLLGPDDLDEVELLLGRRPVENLFLAAKVATFGLDRRRVGKIHGFQRDGRLTAVCLDSATIFPTGEDPDAVPAFVRAIGPSRVASSILGPSMTALGLYVGLVDRWPGSWQRVSNVRRRQPLMVLDHPPELPGDGRVRLLTIHEYESYLAASVHMYTQEIGASPFAHGGGYERFVKERLRQRDAYGIVEDGEVIFKADLGPRLGEQVQLQGVWVHPELRGRGLSTPALAEMLKQIMEIYPVVSLYVNDFNTPAIRSYERLGFQTVGALATVHY